MKNRVQLLALVDDVADVGDHKVDAEHVLGGEHEAAVYGDAVVAVLEQHHVLADLTETAEGDDAKQGFSHKAPSQKAHLLRLGIRRS
jgi:hypothetical protein